MLVVFMLLGDVLPHDKEDGGTDEAVLDRAGEQKGSGVREQHAHNVFLPLAKADHVTDVEHVRLQVKSGLVLGRGVVSVIMVMLVLNNCVVMGVGDLVTGLQDEDVQPDAEVGGDHVHEAEPRQEFVLVDIHLLIEKYEVHLDENEGHLQDRPDYGEQVLAVVALVQVEFEEHTDLDSGVDHRADAKHY